jgi:hypothetical protein
MFTARSQLPAERLHCSEGPSILPDPQSHQHLLPEIQELLATIHLPGGKPGAHAQCLVLCACAVPSVGQSSMSSELSRAATLQSPVISHRVRVCDTDDSCCPVRETPLQRRKSAIVSPSWRHESLANSNSSLYDNFVCGEVLTAVAMKRPVI